MKLSAEQSSSLLANLPWGWQRKIAKQCNCTERHVFNVIHGFKQDHLGIINYALKLIKDKKNKEARISNKIKEVCK